MIQNTSGQDRSLPKRKNRWIKYPLIATPMLAALAWGGYAIKELRQSDYSVSLGNLQVAQALVTDLRRDIAVQGRVVAANSPTLYAPAQGIVTFEVKAGDQVVQGQQLASIQSHELNSEFQQARSQLKRLQVDMARQAIQAKRQKMQNTQKMELAYVNLIAAKREMRRAEQAMETNIISQIDYEKVQDELSRAKLQTTQAQKHAELEAEMLEFEQSRAQLDIEFQQLHVDELQRRVDALAIHSPVTGQIGRLAVEQKAEVSAHTALLSTVDLSSFEVETRVPENYADDLRLNMAVEIQLGVELFAGSITAISPEVVDNQVVARVRFEETPPNHLRQNLRLSARIVLEHKHNILTLPRGAFLDSDGGRDVWKITDNKAHRTPIKIGAIGLRKVEIVAGLETGDSVIISSTEDFYGAQILNLKD